MSLPPSPLVTHLHRPHHTHTQVYERLVAEGVLVPAPDVAVPEIPLDLAAAVKLKKVWAGYEGLGRSVNPDLGSSPGSMVLLLLPAASIT